MKGRVSTRPCVLIEKILSRINWAFALQGLSIVHKDAGLDDRPYCHSERSEESYPRARETLRCAQGGN